MQSPESDREVVGGRTSIREVASASAVGTALEWYDFYVYATASATVLGQLFFPGVNPLLGTLSAFATFAVGFFARPVGGMFIGNFGDKLGRRPVLIFTLVLMGISTALMGLLPTYGAIGIWAPILLVALRLCQGFGAGAEFAGAAIMAVEYSPRERRGFFGSIPAAALSVGLLLSTGIFALNSALLTEDQFLSWGWRIPFLLSILVAGVGLFIRLRVQETPEFAQVEETHTQAQIPLLTVIRNSPKEVLLSAGLVVNGVQSYILQVFVLSYVTQQLGLSTNVALTALLVAGAVAIFTCPFFGALSDRIGRRPVYIGGAAFQALFAFPLFWLLDAREPLLIGLAMVLGLAVGNAAVFGLQGSFLSEIFGTRTRYSGVVLGRELPTAIFGGTAPFVAVALTAWSGGDTWSISLYWLVFAIIMGVSAYMLPETFRRDLTEPERERPLVAQATD